MIPDRLKDIAKWSAGALAVFGIVTKVSAIWALLAATWTSLGSIFTLASIGLLTLPPHVPPTTGVDWAILVIGGAFGAKIALGVWQNYQQIDGDEINP